MITRRKHARWSRLKYVAAVTTMVVGVALAPFAVLLSASGPAQAVSGNVICPPGYHEIFVNASPYLHTASHHECVPNTVQVNCIYSDPDGDGSTTTVTYQLPVTNTTCPASPPFWVPFPN